MRLLSDSAHPHPVTGLEVIRRRGSAVLLAMVFLVLFATLAVGYCASTNLGLQEAHNYSRIQTAQMTAEGGLGYMVSLLGEQNLPPDQVQDDLLLAVANAAAEAMDGAPHMGGGEITFDGTTVRTPDIVCQTGHAFLAEIAQDANAGLWLSVRGTARGVRRRLHIRLEPVLEVSPVFGFGIACRGKITMGGDGTVLGVNNPNEADILSATYSSAEAIRLGGSGDLAGDVYTSNPDSYVTVQGSRTIAGTTDAQQIAEHIHVGIGQVEFPEVDTSDYVPLATQTLSPSFDTKSNAVLENIRIPAGMNPNFTSDVVLRGVIYVESPNRVTFAGQTTIQGVIVTEDAGDVSDNALNFSGGVSSLGVETLPDQPQYAALKQMPGMMVLAPGFAVSFTGGFDCINGGMVVEEFTMSGNAGGVVRGPILCYGDAEFTLMGTAQLSIDRSTEPGLLPGFKHPLRLEAQAGSYHED